MKFQYNNIRIFRRHAGFSQEDIAEKLGVSRQAVARWETGETLPDIETCIQLCDMFEISIDVLVRKLDNELMTDSDSDEKKHIFGVVEIGAEGQFTLPMKARTTFGLNTGDMLLVLGDEDKGLALVKLNNSDQGQI